MKNFRFWRILGLLLVLLVCSSCGDDDEFPTFKFNEDGICYFPSVSIISKASFEETVVGYGWKHVSTHEIGENGECLKNVRGGRMNASASFFYPGRFVNF